MEAPLDNATFQALFDALLAGIHLPELPLHYQAAVAKAVAVYHGAVLTGRSQALFDYLDAWSRQEIQRARTQKR